MTEPFLYRVPAALIAAVLFFAMAGAWEVFFRFGASRTGEKRRDLGPIDAAVAGLLALILAFSFNMASERFDLREDVIVREANAIGTTYRRCDFLVTAEQAACRDGLARYARLRVAFYESAHHLDKLRAVSDQSERLHDELWATMRRSQLVRDTPAHALAIDALNQVIDLHEDRVAAQRRIVPQEVTLVTLVLCLAWGAFAGYVCGLAGNHQGASWIGFAFLASLVVFVSLDLDRPGRGFVRPVRGNSVMVDLAQELAVKEQARRHER